LDCSDAILVQAIFFVCHLKAMKDQSVPKEQQLRNEFVNQSGRFEYNITFSNALAKTPLQTYSDSSSNPHSSKFTPHKNNKQKTFSPPNLHTYLHAVF
jgi:hypothetical protein